MASKISSRIKCNFEGVNCPRDFGRQSEMMRHVKEYHAVRLRCPVPECQYPGTIRKGTLWRHMERNHGDSKWSDVEPLSKYRGFLSMDKSKPSPLAKKDLEDEQHDGGRLPPSSMPLRDSGGRDIDDYPLNDSQEDGSSPCLKETVIDEVAEDMVTEEPEEPQSRGVMTIVNNKRKWTWCSSQLKHLGTYLSSWLLHLSLSRVTGTTRENSTGIKTLRWRCVSVSGMTTD